MDAGIAEILRQAVAQSAEISATHARSVAETAERFREHLGKPWKFRAEAMADARRLESEMTNQPEGQDGEGI